MIDTLDTAPPWRYNGAMNTEQPDNAKVNVRFPGEVIQAMRRLARDDQRSLNSEIIWVLREYIAQRERESAKAS